MRPTLKPGYLLVPMQQVPTDLSLIVAPGALPGPVTIVARASVAWHDLQITFNVLCESHEVVIRRYGDVVLHERLSCSKSSPTIPAAHVHDFGDGLDHAYRQTGYSVRVEMSNAGSGELSLPNPDLLVAFPNPAGEGPDPFTGIAWEKRGGAFCWQTVHCYALPGRTLGVISRSSVDHRLGGETGFRIAPAGIITGEVVGV